MSFDTLLGVAGIILGIAGLATGYIFYKKSLKIKQPMYIIRTNNLIQDSISQMSGLEVAYKGRFISNLSVSKVLFWNSGSETLDNQDIVKTNPLRIECAEDKNILDATVTASNNQSNQLAIEVASSGTSAYVTFDYLDKYQGGIFQVVHTGTTSNDLFFEGDLKGAVLQMQKTRRIIPSGIVPLVAALISSGTLVALIKLGSLFNISPYVVFIVGFAVSLVVMLAFVALITWISSANSGIPKHFRSF